MDIERDRNPLAPPTLDGDKTYFSASRKLLYRIHAINAQAF